MALHVSQGGDTIEEPIGGAWWGGTHVHLQLPEGGVRTLMFHQV